MPHLRHGPTVYNGHLRGPVTLTLVAERLAVELSLPVFTTWVYRDRGSNPELPHARRPPPRRFLTNRIHNMTTYIVNRVGFSRIIALKMHALTVYSQGSAFLDQ